jgi:transposase
MDKSVIDEIQQLDVSTKTVRRWIQKYEMNGADGLFIKPRSGRPPKLNSDELNQLKKIVEGDQERVWVARHVFTLIITLFSVIYSVKYIPEVLRKIGHSFHKAVHYLIKRNEEKRKTWIKERLPKIYEEHIKQGWRIFFQDEVGFQTEGTLTYSWGPKGKKIVVKNKGRHGRVNLIGAYEVGSGDFFYKMTFLRVNALRFKRFLCCLKRKYRTDKIIIIADNASFHKAKWFTAWWKSSDWLKLEFLPAYSPDFNPIERLWKWIKKEYTHNKCWASKTDLGKYLEKKLQEMIENKSAYIGTMKKELERLKNAFEHHNTPFIWDHYLPVKAA